MPEMPDKSRLAEILREMRRRFWRATMYGLEKGPHMTRYAMYRRLQEVGNVLPRSAGKALSISHSAHLFDQLGFSPTQIVEASFPEFNITDLPFKDGEFDMVASDQVLEHVEGDPFTAINETRRVLRTGGLAIHTTVFMYPRHGAPNDFWRYTPDALSLLCREFSEIIECGGWGNFNAWQWWEKGLFFEDVPHAQWHPLHKVATRNDPAWPMVTWIVARK
jgi:SAM-dependent methyltransferase